MKLILLLKPSTSWKHSTAQHSTSEFYEKTLNQIKHSSSWRSVCSFNTVQIEISKDVKKENWMRVLSQQMITFLQIEKWVFWSDQITLKLRFLFDQSKSDFVIYELASLLLSDLVKKEVCEKRILKLTYFSVTQAICLFRPPCCHLFCNVKTARIIEIFTPLD